MSRRLTPDDPIQTVAVCITAGDREYLTTLARERRTSVSHVLRELLHAARQADQETR